MSLNFPSFTYSSNIKCCASKNMSQNLQKRSFTSRCPPGQSQANAIGIIGGEFAESTLQFAKKMMNLNLESTEENGISLVTCSDQALANEFLSLDPSSQVENLRLRRRLLEKSGKVSCIVMPCNLSHAWHDEIKDGCSVPFLHIGECVAKELKEAKLKPLEGGSLPCIGILATNESSVARFYQNILENEGFNVIMPDKGTIEHILIPAVAALRAKDFEGSRNLLRISVQILLVRAANRVILASDELRGVLPADDPLWRKCIDPMDCLARSAVKYAHSVGRGR